MVENIESQDITPKTGKTLYALVTERGFDFFKVIPDIAESFDVCSKEEYNRALSAYRSGEDKDTHVKYNLAIKQYLEEGKEIKIGEIDQDLLSKFSSNKQIIINDLFGPGGRYPGSVSYFNGLKNKNDYIDGLMSMPDENFEMFLRQQVELSQKMGKEMYGQGTASERSMEQLGNVLLLSNFEKDFNNFIQQNPSLQQIPLLSQEELEDYYDKLTDEEKNTLIELRGNEIDAKKNIKLGIDMQTVYNSQAFKDLSPEQKTTFDTIMVEYYVQNQSMGLDDQLQKIWGATYESIKNMATSVIEKTTDSPMEETKKNIIEDKEFDKYFQENQIKNLVKENQSKDNEYYQGLKKLDPELENLIEKDPDIQRLTAIQDPTPEQKQELQMALQEKSSSSEEILLGETNKSIQKQTITSCLDILQSYMDIDLTEQENVLDTFADTEYAIENGENIILQINGKINGKALKLYYNLTTGTLQQEEFLSRETINAPFAINDPILGKKNIPNVQLPKFDDFIKGAENIDYKNIIQSSENLDNYKEKVENELKKNAKKEGTWDVNIEKIGFEKNILKNLATQETFLFMEQNIEESGKSFSKESNEDIYSMYTLIYNSLQSYTVDETIAFRKNIDTLTQYKKRYLQNIKAKSANKEKYILGLLGKRDLPHIEDNQSAKKDGAENSENTYMENYAKFFSIFADTTYSVPIINPRMLDKFIYNFDQEESIDQEYFKTATMKHNFNLAIEYMENKEDIASIESSFEDLPENKKSV